MINPRQREWFYIPWPTAPHTMTTATVKTFDTIMFKIEVDAYVKRKSMLEEKFRSHTL